MAFTDHEIAEAHQMVRERDDSDILYKLGLIYSTGQELDLVQAHMWFNLAAASGDATAAKEAIKERDSIAGNMTPEQISEAQRLAREWKPKRNK